MVTRTSPLVVTRGVQRLLLGLPWSFRPVQVIRECLAEGCDRATLLKVFRNTMALMGRRRNDEQHEHLYFKFQNSK